MKHILALLALSLGTVSSQAQVYTFNGDGVSFFTNPFIIDGHIWAEGVGPVDDTLSFVGLQAGTYNVTLSFEAARFTLKELALNGVNANVSYLGHRTYSFANLETQAETPFTMRVYGWFAGEQGTVGNYVGTLTAVSAVPEPSSWALFMAGLVACGFIVRRRNA